jgi:hypothetical protein
VELLAFLFLSTLVSVTVSRMHARTTKKEIETNQAVLDHRLEIRKLDDARELREQRLLGDGK